MATSSQSNSRPAVRRVLDNPRRTALAPVRFVGFWSAVVLPLVLLPMLFGGFAEANPLVFGGLLVTNLVAAAVGRHHADD